MWAGLFYVPGCATALLAIGALLFCALEFIVFLGDGKWISPIDGLAIFNPDLLEHPWVTDPQSWLGLHIILTSPFGGLIVFAVGLVLTWIFSFLGSLVELAER